MPPMRAPRLALACLPARGRGARSPAAADSGSDSTTAGASGRRKAAPRRRKPTSRARRKDSARGAQGGRRAAPKADLTRRPIVFYPGENRYPFGVLDSDQSQVADAEVALYFAKVPPPEPGAKSKSGNRGQVAKAQAQALDQPAVGPFPAAIESLATKPAFRARGRPARTPTPPRVVYSTQIDFPSDGEWQVAAILQGRRRTAGHDCCPARSSANSANPEPGEKAPMIHTPTAADVGGDLSKITTRIPPDTQNKVDYADALGKEPIVLLFATPQFCQSRVCGPVVDVAEQAKQEYGDKAAFIHMEIYNDNDPAQGSPGRRCGPSTCRASRGCSRSTATATISAAVEGAFGLEADARSGRKRRSPNERESRPAERGAACSPSPRRRSAAAT